MADDSNPFAKFAPKPGEANPFAPTKVAEADNPFAAFAGASLDGSPPQTPSIEPIDYSGTETDVRAKIKALPKEHQKKAYKDWADAYVAKEREKGGMGVYIGDVVRNLARGTPVGSWLDEANALGASLLGSDYDEAKAYQNALDRAADRDTVKVGKLPESIPFVGGHEVTGADLTKLTGGLMSARMAPMWHGASLLGNVVKGGISGTGYAAAYGAGEGDTVQERIENATGMAPVGTALGAGLPVLGRVAGAVGSGAVNAYSSATRNLARDPAIKGYHPKAVEKTSELYVRDELPGVGASKATALGEEGMLGDLGVANQNATAGLARTPGGEAASRNIRDRTERAPGRIVEGVDESVGKPVNPYVREAELRKEYGEKAKPLYDEFYATDIVPDDGLINLLQRVPDSAYQKAFDLMRVEGINPSAIENTGRALDYIKRGLQGQVDDLGAHTEHGRALGNLERELRHHVDNMLSPGNPSESSWAKAREISGEGIRGRNVIEEGSGVFKNKRDPFEVERQLSTAGDLGREVYGEAARNDLRQIMGRKATQYGPKGDTAARTSLNNEFARENLEKIFGPDKAKKIIDLIEAENTMAVLNEKAHNNSITSTMEAVKKTLPQPVDPAHMSDKLGHMTILGLGLKSGNWAINKLTANRWNDRQARIAADMARMLTAQGIERDAIIAALEGYIRREAGMSLTAGVVRKAANELIEGSAPGLRAASSAENRERAP